jgi:hypothetical protein
MLETLTRVVFMLTSMRVRMFGMHSGQELSLQDDAELQACVQTHKPHHLTVCESQRLLCLYSGKDSKMFAFALAHAHDGKKDLHPYSMSMQDTAMLQLASDLEPDMFWLDEVKLQHVAVATVLNASISLQPREDMSELFRDMLWEVIEEVLRECDEVQRDIMRTGYIQDALGANEGLGYISPTSWPPSRVSVWERRRQERTQAEAQETEETERAMELLHNLLAEQVYHMLEEALQELTEEQQSPHVMKQEMIEALVEAIADASTVHISEAQAGPSQVEVGEGEGWGVEAEVDVVIADIVAYIIAAAHEESAAKEEGANAKALSSGERVDDLPPPIAPAQVC